MKPTVLIGSSTEALQIARAIQEGLCHEVYPVIWNQGIFGLSRTTLESLIDQLNKVDYAVFAFTPDDVTKIRDRTYSEARDNVLFEFGLFMGRLGRNRTFFVMPASVTDFRIPTDLLGVTPATYDRSFFDQNPVAALGAACSQIIR